MRIGRSRDPLGAIFPVAGDFLAGAGGKKPGVTRRLHSTMYSVIMQLWFHLWLLQCTLPKLGE